MASPSQDNDKNDAASSQAQTEEETATKRQRLTTSIGTLTSPLPSLPSSSGPTNDSLPAPPLHTFPLDLVTEILYRLPVKFLLQFKCVCKSWKTLISDPKFVRKHLRLSATRQHLILRYPNPSYEFTLAAYPMSSIFAGVTAVPMQFKYPLNKRNGFDIFVGSCHGILCFATYQNSVILFNPSIRKFKTLPKIENPRKEGGGYTTYSFGYDHVTDDYKVVGVFRYGRNIRVSRAYKTLVNVYTLSTNRWRMIPEFPFAFVYVESGKFVSGTVNWLANANSTNSASIIVSLNLGNESYEEIVQPDYGLKEIVGLTLAVLRDCLCVHCFYVDTFSDIWIMKEYGNKESWSKLFTFPHFGDLGLMPYNKALYAFEDGRMLLVSDSMSESDPELALYDSRDLTFTTLEFQNINFWDLAEVYIESLVSP